MYWFIQELKCLHFWCNAFTHCTAFRCMKMYDGLGHSLSRASCPHENVSSQNSGLPGFCFNANKLLNKAAGRKDESLVLK